MKILVTGGSGYVGSILVRRLLEKGHDVRVLDAGYFGHESLDDVRDNIELVEDDIRSVGKDVFKGVNGVIHLAGLSNDPMAEYRPKENFLINVDGTKNMVNLSKEAGIPKFVFGSSCSVYYTTNPDNAEKNEDHFITPSVPYSLSKHMAEDVVLEAKDSTFTPVVFRKGTMYGVSPRMRYDLVVNTLLKDAFLNKKMTLHQGGRMWRPLLDVENAAVAYIYAIEHYLSGVFNLVDMNILVNDLAERIRSILKEHYNEDISIERIHVGVSRSYKVSGEKFRKLGFSFSHSFEEAVKNIWDDLQNRSDIHHEKYYNISAFEKLFPNN